MDTSDDEAALFRQVEALLSAGNKPAAIERLDDHVAKVPTTFRARIHLSRLLFEEGQYAKSIEALQASERFDPLVADFQSVQQCIQRRDLDGAERIARRMLDMCPGHPRAIFTLSHIAQARGRQQQRIAWLEEGLKHTPANLVFRKLLVTALESEGAYRRAVEAAQELYSCQETFETAWGLASILTRYGQNERALKMCDRAEHLSASDPKKLSDVALLRGQLLRILGARDESLKAFKRSLAHNQSNGASWWGLADTKTFTFTQSDATEMRELLGDPSLDRTQKGLVSFALARHLETAGEQDQAMAAYHAANALAQPGEFDISRAVAAGERVRAAFQGDALANQAIHADGEPVPIFIVGLPRSGSTLIEQILASHPEIDGTMELPVLPGIKRRAHALCLERFKADYLQTFQLLSKADLTALGQDYLTESEFFRRSKDLLFTDKMPFNFEHVGFIHKVLPKAVIIDTRRNPLDCGLSIYKQHFTRGSVFAYDLETIGKYYNLYIDLMDHWDRVLPGRVLNVQYESLVRSPEAEIRRLLRHVGVSFEPQCLRFHETLRPVRTASSEQVRQPVYTDGIGAWRTFDTHLNSLRKGLGSETLNRFAPFFS